MSMYFEIEGYWKDDKSEFSGYVVKEFDDYDEDSDDGADDLIFYYGMSESDIKASIEAEKNGDEDSLEFYITSYEVIDWSKY